MYETTYLKVSMAAWFVFMSRCGLLFSCPVPKALWPESAKELYQELVNAPLDLGIVQVRDLWSIQKAQHVTFREAPGHTLRLSVQVAHVVPIQRGLRVWMELVGLRREGVSPHFPDFGFPQLPLFCYTNHFCIARQANRSLGEGVADQ